MQLTPINKRPETDKKGVTEDEKVYNFICTKCLRWAIVTSRFWWEILFVIFSTCGYNLQEKMAQKVLLALKTDFARYKDDTDVDACFKVISDEDEDMSVSMIQELLDFKHSLR